MGRVAPSWQAVKGKSSFRHASSARSPFGRRSAAAAASSIVTADGPTRVFDKTRFGPTFMAQVVVSKCADSLTRFHSIDKPRRIGVLGVEAQKHPLLLRSEAEVMRECPLVGLAPGWYLRITEISAGAYESKAPTFRTAACGEPERILTRSSTMRASRRSHTNRHNEYARTIRPHFVGGRRPCSTEPVPLR